MILVMGENGRAHTQHHDLLYHSYGAVLTLPSRTRPLPYLQHHFPEDRRPLSPDGALPDAARMRRDGGDAEYVMSVITRGQRA